jgi:hypothetical protein
MRDAKVKTMAGGPATNLLGSANCSSCFEIGKQCSVLYFLCISILLRSGSPGYSRASVGK